MVDDMVRNKDIAVVYRHVPFDGVALKVAEMAVGDADILPLIVVALAENTVVRFGDGEAGNVKILHLLLVFAADKYLRHRAVAAHGQPFDGAVATAHVKGDVIEARLAAAANFTALLQDKPPAAARARSTGSSGKAASVAPAVRKCRRVKVRMAPP